MKVQTKIYYITQKEEGGVKDYLTQSSRLSRPNFLQQFKRKLLDGFCLARERERWGQEKIKYRLNKKIENNIFPLVG